MPLIILRSQYSFVYAASMQRSFVAGVAGARAVVDCANCQNRMGDHYRLRRSAGDSSARIRRAYSFRGDAAWTHLPRAAQNGFWAARRREEGVMMISLAVFFFLHNLDDDERGAHPVRDKNIHN